MLTFQQFSQKFCMDNHVSACKCLSWNITNNIKVILMFSFFIKITAKKTHWHFFIIMKAYNEKTEGM